jgi:hypothetical protein
MSQHNKEHRIYNRENSPLQVSKPRGNKKLLLVLKRVTSHWNIIQIGRLINHNKEAVLRRTRQYVKLTTHPPLRHDPVHSYRD